MNLRPTPLRRRRVARLWKSAGVLAALTIGVACSGQERSAEAYCDVYRAETQALEAKYQARLGSLDASADPVGGLLVAAGSLVEAQGDMVVLFDKLSAAAPEEIRSETEFLRETMKSSAEAVASGDLGRMFVTGLVGGLQANGAATAVDSFIATHCTAR